MLDQAAVMLDLVGDNQLAVPEIGDRQIVTRATMQGIRYFFSSCCSLQIAGELQRASYLRAGATPSYPRAEKRETAKTSLTWIKSHQSYQINSEVASRRRIGR